VKSKDFLRVYVAPVPSFIKIEPVYPALRDNEICACSNQTVKSEKYCVWKLLEYAIKSALNKDITQFSFTKNASGKWECKDFEFSLSHSKGVVAVAISNKKVGVDIEQYREMAEGIENKILTDEEKREFVAIADSARNDYLLKKWTQKESIFKCHQGASQPLRINTLRFEVVSKTLHVQEAAYCLSVASSCTARLRLYEGIDLAKH
jgi:phosphopantetheine--protein transferase-like protein